MTEHTPINQQIFQRGELSTDPNSPYRFPVKKARKNRLTDYDGNTYLDFYLQSGQAILGYKHKTLSTAIHNRLSMGYLGGFYSHLYARALKALKEHFQTRISGDFSVHLFTSPETRSSFLQDRGILSEKTQSCSIFTPFLEPQVPYICDRSFSNGSPLDILVLPTPADISPSADISPLILETLIQTLQQSKKDFFLSYMEKLAFPYRNSIQKEEPHSWKIPLIEAHSWSLISESLFKKKILTDPKTPKIYICSATTEADLKILFSNIKPYFKK